ncbi:3-ketoacyl-ACP reductase [Halomonas dongshanensis]|uniref:3-ketoacyl-ACP reductase n=1 Tax=Halomonas dongshanensis TaxID=2890835 RepID=A0ABT2EAX2_9GAMM|nr:3-ketoacyl-ACP reductase [Halomonas dongshanensis]MCS2608738.1 3-ketoacyl-ACP reductase [Halomonas dongshanensis]
MKHEKRALVTGAARGIGRGIATNLAKQGFDVVLNDLADSDDLQAAQQEVRHYGRQCAVVLGDISHVEEHEHLVETAWEALGGLECLVNNAGVSVKTRGDLLEISSESFDRLIAINLRGTFFLTQAVARKMVQVSSEAFRSIVTVSSANAAMASTNRGEYCISKTGLAMMSQLYALRLAPHGINTYEVRPGVIESMMTSVARESYEARFAAGFTPINRWGTPFDVGNTVAALAEGKLGFSTGEVVHVDGGLHLPEL